MAIGGTSGAPSTGETATWIRRPDSGAMDARLGSGQGWSQAIAQRRAAPLTRRATGWMTPRARSTTARHLADGKRLEDEEYARATADLGERRLLELVVLIGYYRTLALMLEVFHVGAPRP